MDSFEKIIRREELDKFLIENFSEKIRLQIALLFNREDVLPIDKWNFLNDILKSLSAQQVQIIIDELKNKYN